MANHFRVSPKFWPWARRHRLTDAQTNLALYLLTCEHRNLEGLYRLPKPYVSADLGWPIKKVEENLAVIIATGFAEYDEDAEVVLIPKALKHQAPSTEKQIAGAVAQLERIPRTSLWNAFRIACGSHCPRLADAIQERWPCDSNSRVGASSISSSNSISSPPNPPEQAQGGQDPHTPAPPPTNGNPRSRGTNPRAIGKQAEQAQANAEAAQAAGALTSAGYAHRASWEQLRGALQASLGESHVWPMYAEHLDLAGVDGDTLVIDGPLQAWSWARTRLNTTLPHISRHVGVKARLASTAEHDGLQGVAA